MKSLLLSTIAALILISCAGHQSDPPILDQEFDIGFGEQVTLDGEDLRLAFTDVSDSRCPIGAACIVAGRVTVTLMVSKGNSVAEMRVLSINDFGSVNFAEYMDYGITLLELNPYPDTAHPLDRSQFDRYKATLLVRRTERLE